MAYSLTEWEHLNRIAGSLGMDPERYRRLTDLDARYHGVHHALRPYAWDGHDAQGNVPAIAARRPKLPARLAKRLVDETVDLLLGEGRFPAPLVDVDRPDDAQTQSTPADDALALLIDHTGAHRHIRQAATNTVVAGGSAIALRFDRVPGPLHCTLDVYPARHCRPYFGDDDPAAALALGAGPRDLIALRVLYAYRVPATELGDRVGSDAASRNDRWFLFRREYDARFIVDFEPVEMLGGALTAVPDWVESARIEHGLGRCPAVWLMARHNDAHDTEGPALIEGIEDLLDAYDYGWSLLDDSVGYSQHPTPVLSGVTASAESQLQWGPGHSLNLGMGLAQGAQPNAKYLEISGAAHESGREHLSRLRGLILDATRVVIVDEERRASAVSGVALERLYRPMLSMIDGYREVVGEAIEELYELLLEVGAVHGRSLRIRGAQSLPAYEPSTVSLAWPPIFEPTADDIAQWATALSAAVGGGILSRDAAIERMAALLRITDLQRERARIAGDAEEALEGARRMLEVQAEASGDAGGEDAGGEEDQGAAPAE